MRLFIFIFILLNCNLINAKIIKPNPSIKPIDVISIQLEALKNNNDPFDDAGIIQTWEFAHPNNRIFTGPINNFIKMIKNPSYSMMLDHLDHKINTIKENDSISFYFVELIDWKGNKYGFEWIVSKVEDDSEFKNCWMTSGVSQPLPMAKGV
tara:strand:- start:1095 stop:1550 length:456 start_codon:yes stop_codon:yes gene_type:complete